MCELHLTERFVNEVAGYCIVYYNVSGVGRLPYHVQLSATRRVMLCRPVALCHTESRDEAPRQGDEGGLTAQQPTTMYSSEHFALFVARAELMSV